MFYTFLKLYKWYQTAQRIVYMIYNLQYPEWLNLKLDHYTNLILLISIGRPCRFNVTKIRLVRHCLCQKKWLLFIWNASLDWNGLILDTDSAVVYCFYFQLQGYNCQLETLANFGKLESVHLSRTSFFFSIWLSFWKWP